MLARPRRSLTIFGCNLFPSSMVAWEWRKSWKRIFGTPAISISGTNSRLVLIATYPARHVHERILGVKVGTLGVRGRACILDRLARSPRSRADLVA